MATPNGRGFEPGRRVASKGGRATTGGPNRSLSMGRCLDKQGCSVSIVSTLCAPSIVSGKMRRV